jgi:hypothetical protein
MSLPAAQQRVLNGIAVAIGASEPRLVSMFAMFTQLTSHEAAPGREQLPRQPMRDFLSVLAIWHPFAAVGSRRPARRRRALQVAQLAMGVALVGLLLGASSASSATSTPPGTFRHCVLRNARCPVLIVPGDTR